MRSRSIGRSSASSRRSLVLGARRTRSRAQPLGTITFPNSGAPAAQADFIRGVAWLHSFGYEEAIDAFRAAQKIDPRLRAGLLGRGDGFNQPLWFHEDVAAGPCGAGQARRRRRRRARRRRRRRASRRTSPPSRRCSGRATKPARDKAYADAMAALAAQFPQDDEAQAFYALSLLAMLPRGDQALPLRQKAGAIVEGVFTRNPQHPGARALHPARLRPRAARAARRWPRRASTRRSRRRRVTRCTCRRMRSCSWACGTKRRPPIRRRGTRRSRGRRAKAVGRAARLSQPDVAAVRVDAAGAVRARRARRCS